MKENANKKMEHFVGKVMKSSALESPSFDFTAKVMSQVTATSRSTVTVYKPLISKSAWVVLVFLTIGLIAFSIFNTDTTSLGLFDKLDFSRFSNLISGVKISQTAMYSLVMFAVMLFVQVPILKHYFNKRIEV
jgi:hypothetical protein